MILALLFAANLIIYRGSISPTGRYAIGFLPKNKSKTSQIDISEDYFDGSNVLVDNKLHRTYAVFPDMDQSISKALSLEVFFGPREKLILARIDSQFEGVSSLYLIDTKTHRSKDIYNELYRRAEALVKRSPAPFKKSEEPELEFHADWDAQTYEVKGNRLVVRLIALLRDKEDDTTLNMDRAIFLSANYRISEGSKLTLRDVRIDATT